MMDFTKYNKGLRFYATLYNINPDVFNTTCFIDIKGENKTLNIYYINLLDKYIIKLLTENIYYYNTLIEKYNDKSCVCYIYKFISKDICEENIINCLDNNCNYLLTDIFYIKVCIHWKKYLDNTFITLAYSSYS